MSPFNFELRNVCKSLNLNQFYIFFFNEYNFWCAMCIHNFVCFCLFGKQTKCWFLAKSGKVTFLAQIGNCICICISVCICVFVILYLCIFCKQRKCWLQASLRKIGSPLATEKAGCTEVCLRKLNNHHWLSGFLLLKAKYSEAIEKCAKTCRDV